MATFLETKFNILTTHLTAEMLGVKCHVILLANTDFVGRDADLMNDMVYSFSQLAGSVKPEHIIKGTPEKFELLIQFMQANGMLKKG